MDHQDIVAGLVPIVIEQSNRGERSFDIFSRLLVNRIVFLGAAIDDNVTNLIVAQLLHLESADADLRIGLVSQGRAGDDPDAATAQFDWFRTYR